MTRNYKSSINIINRAVTWLACGANQLTCFVISSVVESSVGRAIGVQVVVEENRGLRIIDEETAVLKDIAVTSACGIVVRDTEIRVLASHVKKIQVGQTVLMTLSNQVAELTEVVCVLKRVLLSVR